MDKAEIVFIFLSFPRIGKRFANLINDRPTIDYSNRFCRTSRHIRRATESNAFFFCFVSREHSGTHLLHFPYSPCFRRVSNTRVKEKNNNRDSAISVFFCIAKIEMHTSFERETFNRRFRISRRSLRARNAWWTRKRCSRRRTEIG